MTFEFSGPIARQPIWRRKSENWPKTEKKSANFLKSKTNPGRFPPTVVIKMSKSFEANSSSASRSCRTIILIVIVIFTFVIVRFNYCDFLARNCCLLFRVVKKGISKIRKMMWSCSALVTPRRYHIKTSTCQLVNRIFSSTVLNSSTRHS